MEAGSTAALQWTRKSELAREGLKDMARIEKGISVMLITQEVKSGRPGQGSLGSSLSQLRQQLASPENMTDDSRQRLLELDRRLTRLETLGDGRIRVAFSESAASALTSIGAVV